ncbi:MAG: hypothetical protein OXE92_04765 [Bacteroidetes bacterium]|nr:hypothetical protein [Bacteroidota bacterium]
MVQVFYPIDSDGMGWPLWPKSKVQYYDTPQGLLTESGTWYRTTIDLLNEYAAKLFEHEPLEVLLARSDTWLRSSHTLSLWLLGLGVLYYNPWQLAIVVPCFFLVWQIVCPALVSRRFSPLLRVMDAVVLQAILYAGTMTSLAISSQYQALVVGLGGFIFIRWGVLAYIMRPLVTRCWKVMYKLPASDHILRAFIVRSALNQGIVLSDFKDIEQNIIQNMLKKKRK